jgi:aldehyde:ferredoxin oxidoreductase
MNKPVPDDGPSRGAVVSRDEFDLLLDDYYQARGWTVEGIPQQTKLQDLGLQEFKALTQDKEA